MMKTQKEKKPGLLAPQSGRAANGSAKYVLGFDGGGIGGGDLLDDPAVHVC